MKEKLEKDLTFSGLPTFLGVSTMILAEGGG
jgi:hypothetical protein